MVSYVSYLCISANKEKSIEQKGKGSAIGKSSLEQQFCIYNIINVS